MSSVLVSSCVGCKCAFTRRATFKYSAMRRLIGWNTFFVCMCLSQCTVTTLTCNGRLRLRLLLLQLVPLACCRLCLGCRSGGGCLLRPQVLFGCLQRLEEQGMDGYSMQDSGSFESVQYIRLQWKSHAVLPQHTPHTPASSLCAPALLAFPAWLSTPRPSHLLSSLDLGLCSLHTLVMVLGEVRNLTLQLLQAAATQEQVLTTMQAFPNIFNTETPAGVVPGG